MTWSVEEFKLVTHPADGNIWARVGVDLPDADLDMSADFNTPGADMLYFDQGGIQAVWTGTDRRVADMFIQGSLDNTNWKDLPLTLQSVDTDPAGNALWDLSDIGIRFMRVRFTSGSTTTGTINFRYVFKSRR